MFFKTAVVRESNAASVLQWPSGGKPYDAMLGSPDTYAAGEKSVGELTWRLLLSFISICFRIVYRKAQNILVGAYGKWLLALSHHSAIVDGALTRLFNNCVKIFQILRNWLDSTADYHEYEVHEGMKKCSIKQT